MDKLSTYDKLGLPKEVSKLIFILSIVALLAPYVGGVDFGVFKVPQFNDPITQALKIIGPVLIIIAFGCFFPVWYQSNDPAIETEDTKIEYAKQLLHKTEAPNDLIRGIRLLLKVEASASYMRREVIEYIATFYGQHCLRIGQLNQNFYLYLKLP